MLRLEIPNTSHEKEYNEMIKEWSLIENIGKTSPWALFYGKDYNEFLNLLELYREWKKELSVPSTLYFLIEWEKILWWIDIRHNIEHPYLRDYSGHIWYGVRPSERRKSYATKMLELWLKEAKKLGIEKVLICCYEDNIGSKKTILSNWWIFERNYEKDWKISNRYWITL